MIKLINGWTKETVMAQVKKYNNNTKAIVGYGSAKDNCVYLTNDGNRCAVGCFIPTDHDALFSMQVASVLTSKYPELAPLMPFSDEDIWQFQEAHDHPSHRSVYESIEHFLETAVE